MSSKNDILSRVRRHLPESQPLPELTGPWISYPDPPRQFLEVLTSVGGQGIELPDRTALAETVRQLPCFQEAQQVVSLVAEVPVGNVDLESLADPHALAAIDVAVLPGEFAVAENAAVWVTDRAVRHRVLYFITQHLVLIVPRASMVETLHGAYDRLSFAEPGYGLFISGPSKTADIEQSLVIGAHGPRSLTVILVGEEGAR